MLKNTAFDTTIQKLIHDENVSKTKREQGTLFENLTKKILLTEPRFKNEFKEVYLWNEFNTKFGINSQDTGIDLMALTHNDEWVSVQCKAYDIAHTLTQGDLKNFLGINNISKNNSEIFCELSQKLIFHTCKHTSENIDKALMQAKTSQSEARIYGFYDIANFDIEWESLNLDELNSLKTQKQKELYEYQKEALNAIKEHFLTQKQERAKVIMACGTGKSLLSIRTIDALVDDKELCVFFAPSLALINQMLLEFFKESQSKSYKVFAVCSDYSVGTNATNAIREANEDLKLSDISIPVISSPSHLAMRVKHYQSKAKVIIFSTYQSIDVIIEAQRLFKKPFKLIINDEAHRTAGVQKLDLEGNKKDISIWQKTHDNALINAQFRLYLTATPRIFNDKAKDRLKEKENTKDLLLFSMDNESIFGKQIYKLAFDRAISLGILSDYRVLISFISENVVNSYLSKLSKVAGSNLSFEQAGKMISLANALKKKNIYFIDENGKKESDTLQDEPMKRAVCFHSSIKNSSFITREFGKISNDISAQHIDGTDNATKKTAKLEWLKDDDENFTTKILNNAKCLTEGVDVPNLDAVAFFEPRDSVVDTVQAVGRAIRKAEGKRYGYIILPIVLTDEEIKNYDSTIKGTKFKTIWQVVKALRSHDPRLIDKARINKVISLSTPPTDEFELPEANLFALDELFNNIKNAIPKNLGDLAYWELYAGKVGSIMNDLSVRIKALVSTNAPIKAVFEKFCKALQTNLNSSFDINEAISLIAQHIITKPIFEHIFPDLNFAKFDKVSFELDKLYTKLCEFGLESELKDLKPFYESVQKNALYAQSDKAKQDLIRNLYDSLFKQAFAKVQEKLGIVYTPIEVVDFIIHSVNYALNKHFNKHLSDKDIHILDPFTGAGTFITRLMQSGLLGTNLAHKYQKELWANEITLLGYYIAQINITATYHKQISSLRASENERGKAQPTNSNSMDCHDFDKSKSRNDTYKLFDNLLFTDTFESYTPNSRGFADEKVIKDKANSLQYDDTDYLQTNHAKITEFKNTPFKVIIGNPPYSANQNNSNDNNANTSYPALEKRVQDTYVAKSSSTYTGKVYDTLKMAIRYASDRIENNGIVAFVTNGSFIEGNADSGLRACLESEFDYIYIFNLRGNQRTSGETSRKEGGKIFDSGSRTPVAISLLVKNGGGGGDFSQPHKAKIHYYDIGDYLDRQSKLNIIQNFKSIEGIEKAGKFTLITPNKDYDWINQRDYSYLEFMPLGNVKTKLKALPKINGKVQLEFFEIFSQGLITNRDAWCINFSKEHLETNMRLMIKNYNSEVENLENNPNYQPTMDSTKIKWTRALLNDFNKKLKFNFNDNGLIVSSHYRPFTKCHLYLAKHFNEMLYQMPQIYPTPQTKDINILDCGVENEIYIKDFFKRNKYLPNLTICISGIGGGKDFSLLISNDITDMAFVPNSQCFPLYYYEKIESNKDEENLFDSSSNSQILTYRRKDAIRDEALKEVRKIYKDESISKEDIFYYIYALLNHKGYKEKYKDNLSKMLPRIPFIKAFKEFVALGRELANLHLDYENFADDSRALAVAKADYKESGGLFVNKQNSKDFLANLKDEDFTLNKMRFVVKGKKDTIIFNDKIAVVNIPAKAYEYVVNGRSAIEWIMERYQVKIDKDSGIENNPNYYESENGALKGLKGGKYALVLLLSVIEMSVRSVEILDKLAQFTLDEI